MKKYFWEAMAMRKYGGSNRSHLGAFYLTGDEMITSMCETHLPDLFKDYAAMGAQMRDEEEALSKMEGRAEA
jgi:hypothetical protein